MQPHEIVLFKSKSRLIHMREVFRSLPIAFVDVSVQIQRMADEGKDGHEQLCDWTTTCHQLSHALQVASRCSWTRTPSIRMPPSETPPLVRQ